MQMHRRLVTERSGQYTSLDGSLDKACEFLKLYFVREDNKRLDVNRMAKVWRISKVFLIE